LPNTKHFLCRFHIAQNINKKLSSILGNELGNFLNDFWRIASLEDEVDFEDEFQKLKEVWPAAAPYLEYLDSKKRKWAFAYTHAVFVAGVASTQRQESVNFQVKRHLIPTASLSNLLNAFINFEANVSQKMMLATFNEKFQSAPSDPMILAVCKELTVYAGKILREECTLSLSYICEDLKADVFEVRHKDYLNSSRIVTNVSGIFSCSCRKSIWHGILCRHILCVKRRCNILAAEASEFNARWLRNHKGSLSEPWFEGSDAQNNIEKARLPSNYSEEERARYSELLAICKNVVIRSIGNDSLYQCSKKKLLALEKYILEMTDDDSESDSSTDDGDDDSEEEEEEQAVAADHASSSRVKNPVPVRTKGRKKTGKKRLVSVAEVQRKKKRNKCGKCGSEGHNARKCPSVADPPPPKKSKVDETLLADPPAPLPKKKKRTRAGP
jgi:hypothetical protein